MGIESTRSETLTTLASYYRSSDDFHDRYQITVIRGGKYPSLGVTRREDMSVEDIYNTSQMKLEDIKQALAQKYGHLVRKLPLPEKEGRYYAFVKTTYEKEGRFPFHSEVRKRMQWRNDQTCVNYRKLLMEKGYIEKKDGKYIPTK